MAWGDGGNGQLGDGAFSSSNVPVRVQGLTGVTAISGGGLFSAALLADTSVRTWGAGDGGQLGNGTTSASDVPVTVSGLTGATAISAGANHGLAAVGTAGAPISPPPLSIFRATLTPNPGATPGGIANVVFSSVSAATSNDAMAVGTSQAGFGQQGFAEHW